MNASILSFLGLCRRAGCLAAGYDAVCDAISERSAILCLVSSDCSANTQDKLYGVCCESETPIIALPFGMDELGTAIGRTSSAVLAVKDSGFALGLLEKLELSDHYPALVSRLTVHQKKKKKTTQNRKT
jgi:ribosomal protein L7Ae-like RNA K-turn-binding protein